MDDEDSLPPGIQLVEVGRYEKLSQARERGLVIAAMDLPHWVERRGPRFSLLVEPEHREAVASELERFEVEQSQRAHNVEPELPPLRIKATPLWIATLVFASCWLLQNRIPEALVELGAADSRRIIFQGEWWRVFTALTLHADFSHVFANLLFGCLFAAFVAPSFGAGIGWLGIVSAGALGNFLNAWFYRAEPHQSIGASTAVFGALGLLIGAELAARIISHHTRNRWQIIVPLGAGFALLAFLGAGEEHSRTDYMAHLWGFVAGGGLGLLLQPLKVQARAAGWLQAAGGAAAIGVLVLAWFTAASHWNG